MPSSLKIRCTFDSHFDEDIRYLLTALQEGGAFLQHISQGRSGYEYRNIGERPFDGHVVQRRHTGQKLGDRCRLLMVMDDEAYGCIPEEEVKQVLERICR